jgi:Mg-chelatase subunit ChlD
VFDQRLQNERRSDRRRNQRRGRLDPRALSRLERKDPRVFRSEDSPDEKEYAMILVLDRSSSMSSMIGVAERAVATLAYALESVGVDVCILDMYRSRPRVAKPFAVDIENAPETVLTGEAGGGTPLAGVLEIARKRVTDEEYYPAMITVTDGKPNDEEAYRAQLRQTRFPVLGVYVDLSARSRDRVLRRNRESGPLYDQRTIVIDESELTDSLETMAREVMF